MTTVERGGGSNAYPCAWLTMTCKSMLDISGKINSVLGVELYKDERALLESLANGQELEPTRKTFYPELLNFFPEKKADKNPTIDFVKQEHPILLQTSKFKTIDKRLERKIEKNLSLLVPNVFVEDYDNEDELAKHIYAGALQSALVLIKLKLGAFENFLSEVLIYNCSRMGIPSNATLLYQLQEIKRLWLKTTNQCQDLQFKLFEHLHIGGFSVSISEAGKAFFLRSLLRIIDEKINLHNVPLFNESPKKNESESEENVKKEMKFNRLLINKQYVSKVEETLLATIGKYFNQENKDAFIRFIRGEELTNKIDYQGKKSDIPFALRLLNEIEPTVNIVEMSNDALRYLLLNSFTVKEELLNDGSVKQHMALNDNHTNYHKLFDTLKEFWQDN